MYYRVIDCLLTHLDHPSWMFHLRPKPRKRQVSEKCKHFMLDLKFATLVVDPTWRVHIQVQAHRIILGFSFISHVFMYPTSILIQQKDLYMYFRKNPLHPSFGWVTLERYLHVMMESCLDSRAWASTVAADQAFPTLLPVLAASSQLGFFWEHPKCRHFLKAEREPMGVDTKS